MEENGHGALPRSVNIFKAGKVDQDSLQSILESFKDAMVAVSSDVKDIKAQQEAMKKDIEPVISFHKKVLAIAAFLAIPFTMFMGWIGAYIKEHLFK